MFAGGYFAKSYFTGTFFPPNGSTVIEESQTGFWFIRLRRR